MIFIVGGHMASKIRIFLTAEEDETGNWEINSGHYNTWQCVQPSWSIYQHKSLGY